jgi:hypothetical protein
MDPVTAGGLLAPLVIAMDLFALRYWKPPTWSKPDLVLLLPGLAIGIGLGYLLFRFLDHRAIAIVMATITLIFVGLWLIAGAEVTTHPRSTPKAITAGLASGITTMWRTRADRRLRCICYPSALPSKSTQANLRRNDESVLHRRERDQGGAMAAFGQTNRRRLDIDGGLPVCNSPGRMAGLAASRHARPASDLSGLLRIAGRDGVEVIVGRRLRLSHVNRGLQMFAT